VTVDGWCVLPVPLSFVSQALINNLDLLPKLLPSANAAHPLAFLYPIHCWCALAVLFPLYHRHSKTNTMNLY
jgi:hypothetical protein